MAQVLAAVVLSLTLCSPALAACLRDAKGEVVCGAGMCARDQRGDVYCASLRNGSAFRARDGWIICGAGNCALSRYGEYLCSDVEGGAVMRMPDGSIRCEGNCEHASTAWCERQSAGR
jgi:hypothetical protein